MKKPMQKTMLLEVTRPSIAQVEMDEAPLVRVQPRELQEPQRMGGAGGGIAPPEVIFYAHLRRSPLRRQAAMKEQECPHESEFLAPSPALH